MTNDLIYDVGMNNGDDTAYYLHLGFRVVAVEANPRWVEHARVRFREEIAVGRLIIEAVGIGESEGEFPFWICHPWPEWSSFDRSIASRDESGHHSISVPTVRFGSIMERHGVPFYLKVDIEGNDFLCLKDLNPAIAPPYISVEANGIELLDQLHELGYTRFQCISQFHFVPLELPPSPLQIAVEEATAANQPLDEFHVEKGWTFLPGASGAFGEALPGRWHTFEEMKHTYAEFQARKRRGEGSPFWTAASYSFWADFHAARD
jgi:FkbM family methyltransferase